MSTRIRIRISYFGERPIVHSTVSTPPSAKSTEKAIGRDNDLSPKRRSNARVQRKFLSHLITLKERSTLASHVYTPIRASPGLLRGLQTRQHLGYRRSGRATAPSIAPHVAALNQEPVRTRKVTHTNAPAFEYTTRPAPERTFVTAHRSQKLD